MLNGISKQCRQYYKSNGHAVWSRSDLGFKFFVSKNLLNAFSNLIPGYMTVCVVTNCIRRNFLKLLLFHLEFYITKLMNELLLK